MPALERIQLSPEERAMIRRRPDRSAYVGVVDFRGPRGRRYVPARTAAKITEDAVRVSVKQIRQRQYRHGAFPTGSTLYLVDALGNVLAEDRIS